MKKLIDKLVDQQTEKIESLIIRGCSNGELTFIKEKIYEEMEKNLKQSLQQAIQEALEAVRLKEIGTDDVENGSIRYKVPYKLGWNDAKKELDNKINKILKS